MNRLEFVSVSLMWTGRISWLGFVFVLGDDLGIDPGHKS